MAFCNSPTFPKPPRPGLKYKEWKCECCGKTNQVMLSDLEIDDEYYCSKCGSLHFIELMCSNEITVEMF